MSIQRLAACHSEVLAGRLHDVSLAVSGEVRPPRQSAYCALARTPPPPKPLCPSQSLFTGAAAQCWSHSSHGGTPGTWASPAYFSALNR